MKKLISFLMILILGAGIHLQASKPIPSYKVQVSKDANFQEKTNRPNGPNYDLAGKRDMIIWITVAGPSTDPISIWVYSLDKQDILGPYILYDSGEISVPIDDRNWGVIVQCDVQVTVSVYTDDGGGGTSVGGSGNE